MAESVDPLKKSTKFALDDTRKPTSFSPLRDILHIKERKWDFLWNVEIHDRYDPTFLTTKIQNLGPKTG